ncbi:GMC family oxidoreductase [Haloactinopolyspora sp.]|uniref:FAD-dependent oxidoreductase n=1 Tax=Haloactinopolyspora sp. TaxID=1966353 RepID=UPI002623CB1E|nr:GMC family oxidoreductase [Haloactinopolyspora sp.]
MKAHYDVLVIGSGFGGSVTALRLSEKGYRVGVVEAGARFDDESFPATSWDVRRFLFAPALGCYGIQRIDTLRDCVILSGAGVGGGSLVYANTLYEPLDAFYRDTAWSAITDWRAELAPYFDLAKRMLGVTTYSRMSPSDEVFKQVADEMGVGHTFRPAPVGVFLGEPGVRVPDPYFGGAGPDRVGCLHCGACMTGCRYNAKNTLPKNYLYFAERAGAQVHELSTVTSLRPLPQGGYGALIRRTDARGAKPSLLTADQVVVSAGALGTQRLLHRMRDEGHLPHLSDQLGVLTRTNSESILGAIAADRRVDYTEGVAITSSIHVDEHTHIEPVRYGRGSNAMSLLQTVLADGGGSRAHWVNWLGQMWRQRRDLAGLYDMAHWSERTLIALAMQTLDNSITTYTRRSRLTGRRYLTSRQGHGEPNPGWIPVAHEFVRRMAARIGGTPAGTIGEPFGRPMTAHFLGGCTIGASPDDGVIDAWQRVYGHPGLHIVDGSAISANLGANPSLTITAQAERAMAFWPNKGEADPRPPVGAPYRPLDPVAPRHPAIPVET